MATRIMTWNLQGREQPDLEAAAEVVRDVGPDVLTLQEVQRRQARRLGELVGWHVEWRFKHWAVTVAPEGLAILAPTPIRAPASAVLARRWAFWSWKRRIALDATVAGVRVADTHLGAHVGDAERARQAELTAALAAGGVVAGDLNTAPGSVVLDTFARAGMRDSWAEARPDDPGATNWPGPRDRPPSQRLDYVLVAAHLRVVDVGMPDDPLTLGSLSDHLPVWATVEAPQDLA